MVRLLIILVVIILVLSFFGISLQALFNAPTTQANFGFLGQVIVNSWNYFVQLFVNAFAAIGVHIN